jgi:uncharacterized protein
MKDAFEPLDDEELDWLDHFLYHRIDEDAEFEGHDEGVLGVSELDGMLTALVSGPVMVPPSQWIPRVWGDYPPEWHDETELEKVMSLMMRLLNNVASLLEEEPEYFEPLFEEEFDDGETFTIVDDWCVGYMRGVTVSAEHWELDSAAMQTLLAPIMAFNGEQALMIEELYDEQEFDDLCAEIVPNVREIHAYWLAHRLPGEGVATDSPGLPKIGRDDPCFCGSGKPFKHCCLH